MSNIGFDFILPADYLKPALTVSLLSVWVLVGLFYYLNRYTKRRYFTIWTAAWLFYALWLTLCISLPGANGTPFVILVKQLCVAVAAVFLLWGAAQFLKLKTSQRLFGFFFAFLATWSYIGAYHLEDRLMSQVPVFGLIGLASGMTAWCFAKMRSRREYIGAGLLTVGFALWGLYLCSYPFVQSSTHLISSSFFISAVLQLFIAVSMIILVLEEVRSTNQLAVQRLRYQKNETAFMKSKVASTEERYRSLFEQASEGIIITSADDLRILELNETAKRLLGVSSGDTAQPLPAFCQVEPRTQNLEVNGPEWFKLVCTHRQVQVVRRDGGAIPAEIDGAPINFEGQAAYQFFFRELTERARLEQQLRQAEKLSALGQMISGVAHELNNPLAVIKGYLELILARHSLEPKTRADLEKVAHESNRTAKLVSNFLTFAREQPMHRTKIQLNEVVRRVVELRRFDLRVGTVDVFLDLDGNLPETEADPDQIQQVLVNLVTNALQALTEKAAPRNVKITTKVKGEFIQLLVEDNGPGVPAEVLPHIFEPFFTTKQVGTGTGLGLSIAHSILSDHKGRISYQASREGGAGFLVELPIVEHSTPKAASAAEAKPPESEPAAFQRAEILILDDETSIAELLGEMLSLLGHGTTLCNSAPRALELVQAKQFDVVLSDFRMPLMNGQEFYGEAIKIKPELARRIIFLTGDVVNEETQNFLKSTGNPHLAKPFQLAKVEEVISAVLKREAAV